MKTKPPRYTRDLSDYPLVSLRAFREAARHESFTLAASALFITQSAVSHHIKLLEERLKVKLFYRHARRPELTDEGKILLSGVERSFETLDSTLAALRAGNVRRRLVLGVLSSLATKWLLPRLGGFYRAFPNIELIVRSVNHTIDVERENVDLALVTLPETPESPRVKSVLMWREKLFAVCAPDYAKKSGGAMRGVADLAGRVLLHDETEIAAERGFDWASWLAYFKKSEIAGKTSSQYFSQSDLVLQAAIAGHGVALTRTSIAAGDIGEGALINPFPRAEMPTPSGCYLCGLESLWEEGKVSLLRDWLRDEAQKTEMPERVRVVK